MLLVWFRCVDVDTDCLLKVAEDVPSEVTASHESQKQAEWKSSREGRGHRANKGLNMCVTHISLQHKFLRNKDKEEWQHCSPDAAGSRLTPIFFLLLGSIF